MVLRSRMTPTDQARSREGGLARPPLLCTRIPLATRIPHRRARYWARYFFRWCGAGLFGLSGGPKAPGRHKPRARQQSVGEKFRHHGMLRFLGQGSCMLLTSMRGWNLGYLFTGGISVVPLSYGGTRFFCNYELAPAARNP